MCLNMTFKVKSKVDRICSRMIQTAFIEVIFPISLVGILTNTNMKSSKGELAFQMTLKMTLKNNSIVYPNVYPNVKFLGLSEYAGKKLS